MQAANYAIQNGCVLSRAKIHFFKHNDMKDLEQTLIKIDADERRKRCPFLSLPLQQQPWTRSQRWSCFGVQQLMHTSLTSH